MLNLAVCHRRQGKTATAWAEFDKALTHGTKVGFPEAIEEAKRLRDELAAMLSKLTVTVPPATAALEGLTVEVDGNPWPRERWNIAFVIDPGPIRVRARAKGYKPFEVQVELGADKDEQDRRGGARGRAAAARPRRLRLRRPLSRRQAVASGVALDRGRGRGGARRGGDRLRRRPRARRDR